MAEFKVPLLPQKKSSGEVCDVGTPCEQPDKQSEEHRAENDAQVRSEVEGENNSQGEANCEAKRQPEIPPLPYREPAWSGLPEEPSTLEVIKNGALLNEINLDAKEFFVFGRLPTCDVVLDHPSISRYHAVLQYRSSEKSPNENATNLSTSGFYLYDLASTHGTVINKERIRARTYYRIRVGHVMKFGGSTRLFLLQSGGRGQDEVEREAEEEMKEVLDERKRKEEMREQERRHVEEMRARVVDEGISWGMSNEAEEEAEHQFHLGPREPEIDEDAYYNRDPKKALNHYFEEEGMEEVEYEVEEVGQGRDKKFHAKVRLPIETSEGDYIYGEATIAGKKKEAIVACALDACRILDAQGMLRATAAERRKKRQRNWEENDFYDSDEDNFLDRTGQVEHKRQSRMKKAGKFEKTVETFKSLSEKLVVLQREITECEERLEKHRHAISGTGDSLDDFMQQVDIVMDASTVRQVKQKIGRLRKEEKQLQRLVDLAKPSAIADITSDRQDADTTTDARIRERRGNSEDRQQRGEIQKSKAETKSSHIVPSVDFDLTEDRASRKTEHIVVMRGDVVESDHLGDETGNRTEEQVGERSRVYGPVRPEDVVESMTVADNNEMEEEHYSAERAEAKRKKRREKRQKMKEKRRLSQGDEQHCGSKRQARSKWTSDDDPEFASWLPPDDQSGDGKTALNDRFGY